VETKLNPAEGPRPEDDPNVWRAIAQLPPSLMPALLNGLAHEARVRLEVLMGPGVYADELADLSGLLGILVYALDTKVQHWHLQLNAGSHQWEEDTCTVCALDRRAAPGEPLLMVYRRPGTSRRWGPVCPPCPASPYDGEQPIPPQVKPARGFDLLYCDWCGERFNGRAPLEVSGLVHERFRTGIAVVHPACAERVLADDAERLARETAP